MTFAGVFTGDTVTFDSTSRETFLHRRLLLHFSNAFQIEVAPIPFIAARSRLLETALAIPATAGVHTSDHSPPILFHTKERCARTLQLVTVVPATMTRSATISRPHSSV
ncbi:hypothetical protein DEO72_LG10g2591 [Vigna unguiculata]|uniref:Uncharacterized protein n=1 Tax=Vigna unguiculata TaxID=3917 RepID=A0A4D6NDF0_VIGUN|nr:hypothetical protein DEO72_LG10g2591 [Vigna unguiculata]